MSPLSRLARSALERALASSATRHRTLVALVAVPLAGALAGWTLLRGVQSVRRVHRAMWLEEKVEPLRLDVRDGAPRRVNLLLPTIELKHLFGGYITKFNLARKLAEQGLRARIVTVDPTPALPRSWREQVESYAGLKGMFDTVEVAFGRDHDAPLEVSPNDAFIATTWWTAHIANAALRSVNGSRFPYLIQEYEPFTFPMGSAAALARGRHELPHTALFPTELLRDFFARSGYGVFAAGEEEGRRNSLAFQNAITAVSPPTAEEMAG